MSSQVNLAGASILPWAFPTLDEVAAPPAEYADHEPLPPELADDDEPAPILAGLAAEAAQGYAEGLERGIAEGRVRGYAMGLEEGVAAAQHRLAAEAQRLAAIIARLGAPIAALEPDLEEAVLGLALEVARCVIGGEVSRSRDYLVRLIRDAIAKVPIEMGAPQIVLNPADLDLVRTVAPEIEQASATLVADESVEPGGCLVIANGNDTPVRDVRWHPRAGEGVSQVNLTLPSRWRSVMLNLFDAADD